MSRCARLWPMPSQPVIAVPGYLIPGTVGANPVNIEVVGAVFGDDQQRFLARLRPRRHESWQRQRAADFRNCAPNSPLKSFAELRATTSTCRDCGQGPERPA